MIDSAPQVSALAPALAIGVAAAISDVTYRPLRHVVTAVHEAGHAVVALSVGRRLRGIRLNRDSSGETVSIGRSRGPGVVLTLMAGYPAPSLAGVGGLWAVQHEQVRTWFLVTAGALCGVSALLRNVFGVLVLGLSGLALYGLTRPEARAVAAPAVVALSGFLLVAGVRNCLELWHSHPGPDDAVALGRATWLAASGWRVVFLLISLAALVHGAWDVFRYLTSVPPR